MTSVAEAYRPDPPSPTGVNILLVLVWQSNITGWLIAETCLLKTLSGHSFRVTKNLQTNVLLISNFRDKLPFVNLTKSLIFELTKVLLPKRLVLTYSLIAKVMNYQILFTELKSSY